MAQKAHPISVRLEGVAPWKTMWNATKQSNALEFSIQKTAFEYIHRFYNNYGFEVLHYRTINSHENIVYYISLRKKTNQWELYPIRFNQTLPLAIKDDKRKSFTKFYQNDDISNEESILNLNNFVVDGKVRLEKKPVILAPEASTLLPGLRKLTQRDAMIIKSHPQFFRDSGIPAPYLATFIRDQILLSVKRKRRLMPLKYFRTVAGYLESFLGDKVRGIKIQIKGRLPRMGSAGAARSKHLLLSSGALSLQRFSAPMDYGCVDLCTKSGLSSIRVWVSYSSPLHR